MEEQIYLLNKKIDDLTELVRLLLPKPQDRRNNFPDVLLKTEKSTLKEYLDEFSEDFDFSKLVENIYFKESANHCCYITDLARKKGRIYQNNKWEDIHSDELCKLITNNILKYLERNDIENYKAFKRLNNAETIIEFNIFKSDLSKEIIPLIHSTKKLIKT